MPYTFAHPAAVIPVCRLMGRFAVPSALAIGSVAPDLWYLVPGLRRADTHDLSGLLWFSLPMGLAAYIAFHLFLKHPVLALLPERAAAPLRRWASTSLPDVPWSSVIACLLAGALTHVAWDAITRSGDSGAQVLSWLTLHQLSQHGSTVLGTAFLATWGWRKLREAREQPPACGPFMAPSLRACIAGAIFAVTVMAAWRAGLETLPASFDPVALRSFARSAASAGLSAFVTALLAYGVLWRVITARAAAIAH